MYICIVLLCPDGFFVFEWEILCTLRGLFGTVTCHPPGRVLFFVCKGGGIRKLLVSPVLCHVRVS
jgi:hypothetical protein